MPDSRRLLLLSLVLAVAVTAATAAAPRRAPERDVDDLEDLLPRRETVREREAWRGREHLMPRRADKADPPPTAPVRNVAEWEPATGVLIRYPLGLPYALLRDLDDDVVLHVVVSSGYLAAAQSNLQANGVDMARVQFLVEPNDSIWTRDYGPWYVFDGLDRLCIVDHVYNRPWRPNDNLVPVAFAQQQGLPVFSHDMWHTGGNYMTDGAGLGASTVLVYEEAWAENGMTQAQVDQLMADYYGLDEYRGLDYIESGGIHHIDTWAKFLDEETVLVKRVWPSHHTYDELEQRATLLASLTSATGRPYDVHRVDCHDIGWGDPAAYTNSLILNDRIYVPLFGDAASDAAALAAYADAAPGYEILGYEYSGFITDDALHCRAKGVYDAGMLRVDHAPLSGEHEGAVAVAVSVHAYGAEPVAAVDLHYRLDGGPWQQSAMSPQGGDLYAGEIPAQAVAAECDYYVLAADAGGRREGVPRVAPDHWYDFTLLPPTTAAPSGPGAAVRADGAAPNPCNPVTVFTFALRDPAPVRLSVVDARGRRVRTLLAGEVRPAGESTVRWHGRDDAGRDLPSGTYLFVLETAGLRHTRPVTLLR